MVMERMKKALFLTLLALATLAWADRTQAPVLDAVWLARITLNRLELQDVPSRTPGLLPLKKGQLPLSVQLYLKPSGQLDSTNAVIQRLAAKVRKSVAPGSKQKDLLRDSVAVAQEVWLQLEQSLPVDAALTVSASPSTDWRLAWPKASAIVKGGKADAQGRVMVEVALLRALKVPARTALAAGKPVTQYWVAIVPEPGAANEKAAPRPKGKKKAKKTAKKAAPKAPLGYWAVLDPSVKDEEVEAWALDAGSLKRLVWQPQQELAVQAQGEERAIFPAGLSVAARESFRLSAELGRLSATAQGLTATPGDPGTYYVLSVERYRLEVEGAMAPMTVDLLSPYRPQLASWGRELPSRVRTLENEAQAVWTDRPARAKLKRDGSPQDEWQSPPPALGVLHFLSVGLRRPASVLQARVKDGVLEGVILRGDNLTPRTGWDLFITPNGTTLPAQSLVVPESGQFSLSLSAAALSATALTVGTAPESGGILKGDLLVLPLR